MSQEKCTIQAAAKALGVTTKTVYRYLSNGTLSKIKEGARTYILVDDVRTLRGKLSETAKEGVITDPGHGDTETITIGLKQYTDLVDELGQYKGQVIGQARYLLEYKTNIEQKEKELTETKATLAANAHELTTVKSSLSTNAEELDQARATITKARSELQNLLQVKQDAEQKTKVVLEQQAKIEAKERELAEIRVEVERLRLPWWKKLWKK